MDNRKIRTCSVCRANYEFCLCNPEDRDKPTFYFAFCSENCKDIYNATSNYESGAIDAQAANEQLSKLDLSNKENFGESYRNTLKKISDELKKTKVVEESVVEEMANGSESVEIDTTDTTKVLKNSSKKRGNKNVE